MPEQAAAAVRCAVAMRRALEEHNRERLNRSEKPIEIGIGVNTGRVILGTIGSDTRMESCVIGDTVNLASRIQDLTKRYGVKVLISESTLRDLANPEQFSHREIDVVQVEGKSRSVAIYEIFEADLEPIKSQKLQSLSLYIAGLGHFRGREWEKARASFFCLSESLPCRRGCANVCAALRAILAGASWNRLERRDSVAGELIIFIVKYMGAYGRRLRTE